MGCNSYTTLSHNLYSIKCETPYINKGEVRIILENLSNKTIKVPKTIPSEALIITDFQKIINDGYNYENIRFRKIQFDCIKNCFPLTEKIKQGKTKVYNFIIFNEDRFEKDKGKYRIKLYLEDYFFYKKPVMTDWIYFEIK